MLIGKFGSTSSLDTLYSIQLEYDFDPMNALEARALTDEFHIETWAARLLRTKIYTVIRGAAESGWNTVEVILYASDPGEGAWIEASWIAEVEDAVEKLRGEGYSVENEPMNGMVSRRVRVSW